MWFYPQGDDEAPKRPDRRQIAQAINAMSSCTPVPGGKRRERPPTEDDRSSTDRYEFEGQVQFGTVFHSPAVVSSLRHQQENRLCDPIVARLLLQLWKAFFSSFRDDERGMELPYFKEEAGQVQERLDNLPLNGLPDLVTCRQMSYLLVRFEQERFAGLNERLQELVDQSRGLQNKLEQERLTAHYSVDELERSRGHLLELLAGRGVDTDDCAEDSIVKLVDRLLAVVPRGESAFARPAVGPERSRLADAAQALLAGDPDIGGFELEGLERIVAHQIAALIAERDAFKGILYQAGLMPGTRRAGHDEATERIDAPAPPPSTQGDADQRTAPEGGSDA